MDKDREYDLAKASQEGYEEGVIAATSELLKLIKEELEGGAYLFDVLIREVSNKRNELISQRAQRFTGETGQLLQEDEFDENAKPIWEAFADNYDKFVKPDVNKAVPEHENIQKKNSP